MRFNSRNKNIINYENSKAYKLSAEIELYSLTATSSLENQFYEGCTDKLKRIRHLIAKNNPVYVSKLAIYARNKMNLRSISLVLLVELAKIHNGDDLISKSISRTIKRADEITELLAYYQIANNRDGKKKLNKLSKQIQKGLNHSFNKFDEYQFAKYNKKAEVSLKDALFLVHPKAKNEDQQLLFNKIVDNKLAAPYTWEVELSKLGQKKFETDSRKRDAFKLKWQEMIDSGNIGYMALLRNLKNILKMGVSADHIKKLSDRICDADEVRKSKQLPFRYLSAYREMLKLKEFHTATVISALEKAVIVSAENIKGYSKDTKVLVACDVSGSMQEAVSRRSSILYYDIGLMLGMLLQSRCDSVITGIFGDSWKIINLPKDNILANVQKLHKKEGEVGYSTNGHLIIKDLLKRRVIVDKVMIFTDLQLWDSIGDEYGNKQDFKTFWRLYKEMAAHAKLYLFDLAGYGNTPLSIKDKDVYLIAGWSDKIFEVLNAIEGGYEALSEINRIEL